MKPSSYLPDRHGKSGTIAIELVDEDDFGDLVMTGLGPYLFRLGLDTSYAVQDTDGAIKDTQGAQDLECKVCMAGCVDEIDGVGLG